MDLFLIVHTNGSQTVAILDDYKDILIKYPETYLMAIKLDKEVIADIKESNYLDAGQYM